MDASLSLRGVTQYWSVVEGTGGERTAAAAFTAMEATLRHLLESLSFSQCVVFTNNKPKGPRRLPRPCNVT